MIPVTEDCVLPAAGDDRTDMRDWTQRFLDYTAGFGTADTRYELKRVHTLGVLGYMNALLKLEGITAEDPDLAQAARIAAVFHDIGRFEQLRRHDTFFDAKSADHAALSVQVLEETAMLQDVEKAWRQRILTAIAQHNRLETDIDDPVASRLCDLVRDADRLDIYRVFAVDDIQDMTAHTAEEAAQSTASPAVIEALLAGRPVDKRDRQTPMDLWLTYLGFVNDFRFPASYRLCKAAGFWGKRFDSMSLADPAVRACLEHVEVVLNEHCTGPERDTAPD